MLAIRTALESDIAAIGAVDAIAQIDGERLRFIREEVRAGHCYVACRHELVLGYGVLNYSFYGNGFVQMLYVAADERRNGVGREFLVHLETRCSTSKLFTSTNLSNEPMLSLLMRSGYALSGMIYNLDDGDPEVVFFKFLR